MTLLIQYPSINKVKILAFRSYRTGIYYLDETDLKTIQTKYNEIQEKYDSALAVEVEPLRNFFNAEEYHQKSSG